MKQNPFDARGARRFLEDYWQKRPLIARGVLPQLAAALDRARLFELAGRDDVESRLVLGARASWRVEHGPFRRRELARLPPRNWTLLVNGVENFVSAARDLQVRFGFVPYARQDDVMVSYAAPGGGVGPHVDSYDVFLIQGAGARRWQISRQRDLEMREDMPLKILRRFRPQREWTLRNGDVLYLPPHCAHHGVAIGECMTWSLGCRAPGPQETAARFLEYVQDRLRLRGDYHDPWLKPQRHAAVIGESMVRAARAAVDAIRWSDDDIECWLGEYLSAPRPNVVYQRPRAVAAAQFARIVAARGVRLGLKSRMLAGRRRIFINGESAAVDAASRAPLRELADRRALPPRSRLGLRARALLYQWYRAGYIEPGGPAHGSLDD